MCFRLEMTPKNKDWLNIVRADVRICLLELCALGMRQFHLMFFFQIFITVCAQTSHIFGLLVLFLIFWEDASSSVAATFACFTYSAHGSGCSPGKPSRVSLSSVLLLGQS